MGTFLDLWWIFPASVAFATVAVGSGVSGALFSSPFFMLVVGLAPAEAVGAGLLTEMFGMGNGLRAYVRQRLVDYAAARWLLAGAVPATVVGALAAHRVPGGTLELVFGSGLLLLAGFLIFLPAPEECEPGAREGELLRRKAVDKGETVIRARDGTTYRYATCWRPPGVSLAAAGGLLTGMISAGLPEVTTSQLILRCRVPPRVAVATSVFTLAIAAGAGAAIHAISAAPAWRVVGWSVPGVLLGSTLGSRLGRHLPADLMEKMLGAVFAAVGGLVLALRLLRGF